MRAVHAVDRRHRILEQVAERQTIHIAELAAELGVSEMTIRRDIGRRDRDGVLRRLEFLRPLRVSILSERRGPYVPFGLNGGAPGALGENTLQRAGKTELENLGGKVKLTVSPGDILKIAKPGGGASSIHR